MKKFLSLFLSLLLVFSSVPLMKMVFAEEKTTYEVGDTIYFGSYPQSEVRDEETLTSLNALSPEWEEWTNYGYYSGNCEYSSMVQGDWMRYIDVEYCGEKYRGVKFTQYRPQLTYFASAKYYTLQDDNGYTVDTVYWFKFEPLTWQVLDPDEGLVLCTTAIDSQPYSNNCYYNDDSNDNTYAYYNDNSYINFSNDYETSSIRKWLNSSFYDVAFTDTEKNQISARLLNNDGYYTSTNTTGYEAFDSKTTEDNIFLLSYEEVQKADYGLVSSEDRCIGSDYAKCQGLISSTVENEQVAAWLLRSAGSKSQNCCLVGVDGIVYENCSVSLTYFAVRPSLKLSLSSNDAYETTSEPTTTEPTTTEPTTTEPTTTEPTTTEPTTTEPTTTEPITTEPTTTEPTHADTADGSAKDDDCSHICHKSGFLGFIWKILCFFFRLLKTNPICDCGIAHY